MTHERRHTAYATSGRAVHSSVDRARDLVHDTDSRHGAKDQLQELLIGWALMQMYGQHVAAEDKWGAVEPQRTLPERLATMLLERSVRKQHDQNVVEATSHDIAHELGVQRETVSAILRAFRRQQLIDIGYRTIILRDIPVLSELSDTASPQPTA